MYPLPVFMKKQKRYQEKSGFILEDKTARTSRDEKNIMKNEKPEFSLEDLNQKIFVQDEIITLAKDNSPRLLNKFRLVYPDFFKKISVIQPNLKNSELIFCIYLKLNLTTKEIATYTFVTPKAIQNRKNRLRKKLSIPSEMDIYKWFNDL
ncbi:DNA-binding CsgD family transcriptional regulator [Chryseobacterium sp. SORGH_AS909]|uniref:DNA-binding CsgD family transcriptional regulator n=2 Tax=Chryseobacterium group TaxID=2782232 RepID=A0ABU0TH05_9FLAO|nr:DNA-binding CsgD family transcriptional regulator [Chryseobacterium camelliae]MDQ1100183.1 DNA-binding CsgD family transcriptional regulator [Chryseobacterium sp. SORGH_AS_1048]MDR6087527.1 DNA-binding CsgD family transcriptional regulator [Chryseobacterium sp. SORGH_AS_0909]MDR6131902.1 DNA-binding CsgD family transcriptional regulator [Chryseobacterium sp. SORGH_AS_1175]MDT3405950.1 DNA-binding CsgD family transcriptional regulator [Pseudacidovorax intermedius]